MDDPHFSVVVFKETMVLLSKGLPPCCSEPLGCWAFTVVAEATTSAKMINMDADDFGLMSELAQKLWERKLINVTSIWNKKTFRC